MPKNAEVSLASIVDDGFYYRFDESSARNANVLHTEWYLRATKETKHAEWLPMTILFKIMQLSPRKYQQFLVP